MSEMSNVPDWWQLTLLALAAWRTFRLIAADDIFDRPRRYLLRLGDWEEGDDLAELPDNYRDNLAAFISCPYCLGFWIAVTWWAAWLPWPHATTLVAAPLAISTLVIGVSKLDTDE